MRIWKYTLEVTDWQTFHMPDGAKILAVQMQNGQPQLWVLCNDGAPTRRRIIGIYGTGNLVPDEPGEYIATFQTHGGELVWHVFDLGVE